MGTLDRQEIADRLKNDGLIIQTGRFWTRVRVNQVAGLPEDLALIYPYTCCRSDGLYDFDVELKFAGGWRRFIRQNVSFYFSGHSPFTPLPASQYLPLLEWGLNWCVSNHFHDALIIHAAVVEKNGKSVVLPGQPGSGKSTLCAAMVSRGGYRLLSDELTMLDPATGNVIPNPRPLSLKNKSIEIMKRYSPGSAFTNVVSDTIKGSVCLMCPPDASVESIDIIAEPGLVVFPRYDGDVEGGEITEIDRGEAFIELANHSFNYPILAEEGFRTLGKHLDRSRAYSLVYDGDLDAAIDVFDELLA